MSWALRIYEPWECGGDGYPELWHDGLYWWEEDGETAVAPKDGPPPDDAPTVVSSGGVKHLIRAEAGHRCVRCGHPYRAGCGTWGEEEENPERPPSALLSMLEDGPGRADVQLQMRVRPPLWSPCDERCTHGGPLRYRKPPRPWEHSPDRERDESIALALRRGMEVQAAWRILTVHHLNERKFDLRWHNLVSLCQRCHLTIQRRVQMERVWPWEHSDWFKPYAAAFYAASYLGEELTRAEVEARMDELLALERVA